MAGGTGLYFRAALAELQLPPAPPPGAREKWSRVYDEDGGEAAHAVSAELDPAAAERVHPNDRRRVVRALELAEAGASLVPRDDRLFGARGGIRRWSSDSMSPKTFLEDRIAARTRRMFELGVENEVRQALEGPVSATARNVIGLDEIALLPRAEAIDALIVRTRRYAAYQRKWMRSLEGVVMVAADRPPEETAAEIVELARTREHLSRP